MARGLRWTAETHEALLAALVASGAISTSGEMCGLIIANWPSNSGPAPTASALKQQLTALRKKAGLAPAGARPGSSATSTPKRASGTRGGKTATTPSSSNRKSGQKIMAPEDDNSCDSDSSLPGIKDVMANTPSKLKRKPFRYPPGMPVNFTSPPVSTKRSQSWKAEDSESTPPVGVKREEINEVEDDEETPTAKRTKFNNMNPFMEDVLDEDLGV